MQPPPPPPPTKLKQLRKHNYEIAMDNIFGTQMTGYCEKICCIKKNMQFMPE
jgi:hypothetical protein